MEITERLPDVLQNIESSIVETNRRHHGLTDADVSFALEAVVSRYRDELRGFPCREAKLDGLQREVSNSVQAVCEWRLGRSVWTMPEKPEPIPSRPTSLEDMVACLRRIQKSVAKWNKCGGQRGYLEFIQHFLV